MLNLRIKLGSSRIVILCGGLAIKLPRITHWNLLLHGLIANMNESLFSKTGWIELCPVLFAVPGGFLVVMPRCTPLTQKLTVEQYNAFVRRPDYIVPAEHKLDSFGYYEGRLVAIDYG